MVYILGSPRHNIDRKPSASDTTMKHATNQTSGVIDLRKVRHCIITICLWSLMIMVGVATRFAMSDILQAYVGMRYN